MNDLISRQAAIDALKKAYWDKDIQSAKDDPCIVDAMTDWTIRQIKALPSAQPKRGKWYYSNGKPATIGRSFGMICDQCGTESEYCTNFCGECGADMRGD